jgi:oligosaccharide repeat unit polymerase
MLFWFLLASLALGLPALIIDTSREGHHLNFLALMGWSLTIYAATRLAAAAAAGKPRFLTLTFFVYVYVWLGLAPLVQLSANQFPRFGIYSGSHVLLAFVIVWLGLGAYEVGRLLGNRPLFPERVRGIRLEVTWRRLACVSVAVLILSALLIWRLGGVLTLFLPRNERLALILQTSGNQVAEGYILMSLLRVPPFVVLLYLLLTAKSWRRTGRLRAAHSFLIGIFFLLNVVVNNPIGSPRFWFGTIVFSLAFLLMRWHGSRTFTIWVVGLIALMVVVFPFADIFRNVVAIKGDRIIGASISSELVSNGDYASFQQLISVLPFVENRQFSLGAQGAAALFVFVPRRFWTSKSVDTGELVAENMGYGFTNLEMPLWGEAYVDWGLLGVAVYFLVFGFGSAAIERAYTRRRTKSIVFAAIFAVLGAYQILVLRGTLVTATAYAYPLFGFLILPWITSKRAYGGTSHSGDSLHDVA